MASSGWVLAKDYDEAPDEEAYGWRLPVPEQERSAFIMKNVLGGFEWSVGGWFNTYVDAEGACASLEKAQEAAEEALSAR